MPKITSFLLLAVVPLAAQEERIRAVENGLTTPIVPQGRSAPRRTLADRMAAWHVPAVSVAVVHNYRIDWAKAYGFADRAANRPANTETLFQAGSIRKPIVAIAAMKLVKDGALALDEDISRKLGSWKLPDNELTKVEKVTLRRLLSHTAGITVHGFPGYAAGTAIPSLPDILDGRLPANTPPIRVDRIPGATWRYSGGGYTIVQLLLTDVTGERFPALLRRLVFDKARMDRSTYEQPLPEAARGNAAVGHNAAGAAIPGRYHTYPEMAAAGLWTTPSDLARFGIEMQKAREGHRDPSLRKDRLRKCYASKRPTGDSDLGLGPIRTSRGFCTAAPMRAFGRSSSSIKTETVPSL